MKKVLLAIVLLALAGLIAFGIKENIDSRYPQYAIPQLEVLADTQEVTPLLAGCDWSFRNGRRYSQEVTLHYYVEPIATTLLGGEQLSIELSVADPVALNISRSDAPYSLNLEPVRGDLRVPFESGEYLYEVYATYEQGFVVYYFRIKVQ